MCVFHLSTIGAEGRLALQITHGPEGTVTNVPLAYRGLHAVRSVTRHISRAPFYVLAFVRILIEETWRALCKLANHTARKTSVPARHRLIELRAVCRSNPVRG